MGPWSYVEVGRLDHADQLQLLSIGIKDPSSIGVCRIVLMDYLIINICELLLVVAHGAMW
jgi:hypothetical protein